MPVVIVFKTQQPTSLPQMIRTIERSGHPPLEFAAILKTEGIDGLIAALNRKADMLTGTTAQALMTSYDYWGAIMSSRSSRQLHAAR